MTKIGKFLSYLLVFVIAWCSGYRLRRTTETPTESADRGPY